MSPMLFFTRAGGLAGLWSLKLHFVCVWFLKQYSQVHKKTGAETGHHLQDCPIIQNDRWQSALTSTLLLLQFLVMVNSLIFQKHISPSYILKFRPQNIPYKGIVMPAFHLYFTIKWIYEKHVRCKSSWVYPSVYTFFLQ